LTLREIDRLTRGSQFDAAAVALSRYHDALVSAAPLLKAAEPWSLFNRDIHDAHFAALRQLYRHAIDPASVTRSRPDVD